MKKTEKTFFDGEKSAAEPSLSPLLARLPLELAAQIGMALSSKPRGWEGLGEIRLRRERPCTLSVWGQTVPLAYVFERAAFADLIGALCGGAIYAHREEIRRGYISVGGGVRVGIAGRATGEGGEAVTDFTSLVIRVPRCVSGAGEALLRAYRAGEGRRGVLLWAKPGEGKTTALRDLICRLAVGSGPAVAVVDTRGEFEGTLSEKCHADLLVGYSRGEGISIALRTLAPALIVCDEIGGKEDARAIEEAGLCGVPLIASVHGGAVEEVVRLPHLRRLLRRGLFGYLVGICRRDKEFVSETVTWEEARGI